MLLLVKPFSQFQVFKQPLKTQLSVFSLPKAVFMIVSGPCLTVRLLTYSNMQLCCSSAICWYAAQAMAVNQLP